MARGDDAGDSHCAELGDGAGSSNGIFPGK
jgi:hypothetical protein